MPILTTHIARELSSYPIFKGVAGTLVEDLAKHTSLITHAPKQTLVGRWSVSDKAYLISEGEYGVYTDSTTRHNHFLHRYASGDLAYPHLITTRVATQFRLIALRRSKAYAISKSAFNSALADCVRMRQNLEAEVVKQTEEMLSRAADLSMLTSRERFLKTIYLDAIRRNDRLEYEPRFSKTTLSSIVGCRREMISRILADLEAEGIVRCDVVTGIYILNPDYVVDYGL